MLEVIDIERVASESVADAFDREYIACIVAGMDAEEATMWAMEVASDQYDKAFDVLISLRP
jgi:hypothetical protein